MERDTLTEMLNINQLLLKIGISQRTIFDWLSFNSVGIVSPAYLKGWLGDIDEPIFTSDTYDLLMHAFYQKVRYGLLISDLNNIILCIIVVRFLILSIRYNFLTSFLIVAISFVAGSWWYIHLRFMFSLNYKVLTHFPVFRSIAWSFDEILRLKEIDKRLSDHTNYDENRFKTTFDRIWYECTSGELYLHKKTLETNFYRSYLAPIEPRLNREVIRCKFYLDPAALFVNYWRMHRIPGANILIKLYYLFSRYLNNKIVNHWFPFIWDDVSDSLVYTLTVRMGKKYCPYLIRWHFTYLGLHKTIEAVLMPVWERAYIHMIVDIIPPYSAYLRNEKFYVYNKAAKARDIAALNTPFAKQYLFFLLSLQFGVIAVFVFNLYAMLHAFSGQYFYVPFFTENVELNVGPRTPESIYSGGSTAWQDKDMNTSYQLWHGWFGRGTDKPSIITLLFILLKWIVIKILEILRLKKVFLRFFKFLRNKFKEQKN